MSPLVPQVSASRWGLAAAESCRPSFLPQRQRRAASSASESTWPGPACPASCCSIVVACFRSWKQGYSKHIVWEQWARAVGTARPGHPVLARPQPQPSAAPAASGGEGWVAGSDPTTSPLPGQRQGPAQHLLRWPLCPHLSCPGCSQLQAPGLCHRVHPDENWCAGTTAGCCCPQYVFLPKAGGRDVGGQEFCAGCENVVCGRRMIFQELRCLCALITQAILL